MVQQGPFWSVYQDLKAGHITRRQFIAKATALGVGLPVTMFVLNSVKLDGAFAQDSSAGGRSDVGTEGQTRGAGGEVKILQWQAATLAFTHKGGGTKDQLASSLILEPLMSYGAEGELLPTLVTEVPTVENGRLSEDLTSASFTLLDGLLWSDGEPVTSDDVVFTWQWIMNPDNASVSSTTWEPVDSIDVTSPSEFTVNFKEPSLSWYVSISGAYYGSIIAKHILDVENKEAANQAYLTNPIGTGPYKMETFKENDQALYVVNENYREPNKPYFASVNLKGGGSADSAAQAVLQTGDWDMAWNLQVEPQILTQLEEEGGQGKVYAAPPTNIEAIRFNFTDPNKEVDGQRSSLEAPHPFLTDINVRKAISLATDGDTIANQFYLGGDLEPGGVNFLTGIPEYESPNTVKVFDLDLARQTLEDGGWVMDGDVRAKDGIELKLTYFTSINAVRQKTQAVNKKNWEDVGFKVQLGQVDSGVFFDSAPGNEQTYGHFYRDIQMYTNGPVSPFPLAYMQTFYSGDLTNVSQKSNEWSGNNNQRYINEEYNALYDELVATTDAERAAELFIGMNDIAIMDYAIVSCVSRSSEKYAYNNRLVPDNVVASGWEPLYWNIANWTAVEK